MKNLQEQTKQKIILELEHARLWTSFLVPLFAIFISVVFTNQYIGGHTVARYSWGLFILCLIIRIILLRKRSISRAKKYIDRL